MSRKNLKKYMFLIPLIGTLIHQVYCNRNFDDRPIYTDINKGGHFPGFVYLNGGNLQHMIDTISPHSTVICDRNKQRVITTPIVIRKPIKLVGLNARLTDNLGKTSIVEVRSEGVTITDFELYGNASTVSQKERAALITIYAGDFRIERGTVENSSKEGIEVDQRENPTPIDGGVIRDIVGKGCVRDVVSLGGPAGPEPHVRNVLVENIRGYNSSMRGVVEVSDGCEYITVRKIYAENCIYAIDVQDHNKHEINRHIFISDVHALRCDHAIRTFNHLNGHLGLTISNLTAKDCKKSLYIKNTNHVQIQNLFIEGYDGEEPAIVITNCDGLTVRDVDLIDCTSGAQGLLIENCENVIVDGLRLRHSGSLASAVTYRISEDKKFENLSIRNVNAVKVVDAGIILEKESENSMLKDYIISGNMTSVSDQIMGTHRIITQNTPIK
ncbi:hypothetical protein [Membranihabitans maritimus]|uniref:hypothetical protein n=1 Tax=Membranihabitans maritimus TaxID=2904244 RepID=UPI001F29BCF9|nr:hypothetical protein [Membranihabitans maritimus]